MFLSEGGFLLLTIILFIGIVYTGKELQDKDGSILETFILALGIGSFALGRIISSCEQGLKCCNSKKYLLLISK